jgi:amidase
MNFVLRFHINQNSSGGLMKSKFATVFTTIITLLLVVACNDDDEQNEASLPQGTVQQIEELDIASIQLLMDEGSLTSKQLTKYYLDKIKEIDNAGPNLNAILQINPDAVQIAADMDGERSVKGPRGPLHGIPVVLKANIDTGDQLATTAGSLALSGHQAKQDAFFVARLRAAGMVILGKANLSEWANFRSYEYTSSGWSSEGGQTKNPYVLDRNPCGSSSGSAVAVTANLTMVSVGTETDGSIVCPSSTNGVVGIKPTLGLVSRHGIIPIAHSFDTAGPMARTVKDAALLLSVMVAQDIDDPASQNFPEPIPDYLASLESTDLTKVRLGIMRTYSGAGVHTEVEEHLEKAIKVLESLGAEIIDPILIEIPDEIYNTAYDIMLYEFRTDIDQYLQEHDSPNGMGTLEDLITYNTSHSESVLQYFDQEIFLQAVKKGPLTDEAYQESLESGKKFAQRAIDEVIEQHQLNAIIVPTNGPAWVTDLSNGDDWSDNVGHSFAPAMAGYPNITVPMGDMHGLPLGLSFFGTAYSEPTLLQITNAFEQKTKARKPPEYIPTLDIE